MSPAKESMIEIIGRQPDDSTYDEILRELAFARMVQRGLDDSAAGRGGHMPQPKSPRRLNRGASKVDVRGGALP